MPLLLVLPCSAVDACTLHIGLAIWVITYSIATYLLPPHSACGLLEVLPGRCCSVLPAAITEPTSLGGPLGGA
jgi:hypothetical protein